MCCAGKENDLQTIVGEQKKMFPFGDQIKNEIVFAFKLTWTWVCSMTGRCANQWMVVWSAKNKATYTIFIYIQEVQILVDF